MQLLNIFLIDTKRKWDMVKTTAEEKIAENFLEAIRHKHIPEANKFQIS